MTGGSPYDKGRRYDQGGMTGRRLVIPAQAGIQVERGAGHTMEDDGNATDDHIPHVMLLK